ncbi:MAG: enoyl-CoA hydratase/isomerase family protein, partial [Jannaschia sp.]
MALVDLVRRGTVAILTLNDPDRRNAMSPEMRAELLATLDPLCADGTCRSLVLTGAGGTFCAGGDLKSMRSGDPIYARHRMMVTHRLVRLLAAGPKPVVAAVEGHAFGAGLSLAALADICVVGRDASFGAVFGRVGLMADLGLLWSLPQRIGAARARRLMLTAGVMKAAEAAELGLAD